MVERSHIYIPGAFLAGVVLTLAAKDFRSRRQKSWDIQVPNGQAEDSLGDGSKTRLPSKLRPPPIVDGIEGCIGNTPLVRIRSLSEATGCEILAKAEVRDTQLDLKTTTACKLEGFKVAILTPMVSS